eukprot:superscaffoldBa00001035_g8624
MTRGRKKHDQQEEPDDGASASADQRAMAAGNQGKMLDELACLVKSLIQSQAARDQQTDKDFCRQEQRWKSMQHQFQQMQLQVNEMKEDYRHEQVELEEEQPGGGSDEVVDPGEGTSQTKNVSPQREPPVRREPKLLPLSPEDDTEHFLTTFEKMAQVCQWPKDEWAVHLVPLLTGKARSAYVLMDIMHCEDYEKVKAAILAKCEITADTFRRRFRSMDILRGETPRELYVRLKDLFSKWVETERSTVKEISEMIILEQFLRMVHPELEVWIREHDPRTAEEAAQLAEVFTAARRGTRHTTFGRDNNFAQRQESTGGEQGSGQAQGVPGSPGASAQHQQFVCAVQDEEMTVKFFLASTVESSPDDWSHLINDLVERVGKAKYITTMDLSKGYWWVALAPEAQVLTAFKTPFAAYLGDVVIFSQSLEEHMLHLHQVLQCIRAAGLTINPQKCAVAWREVEYLGYVIGFGNIKPRVGKVEAIKAFPVPTTKSKEKSFMCLVEWYRKFIPHFGEHSVLFNNLTRASAPNKVHWTKECDRAFRELNDSICAHSDLYRPDFGKPFTLQTDVSGVGLGGVLLQEVDGEISSVGRNHSVSRHSDNQ